jgi:hypothetical protein
MGFTSAGPTKYAQASAAGRYRTDPAGSFQAPVDFTNTTSSYNPGASRWGDYTQTVVDPNDDMTMWTFSEYAPATNAWGVRAAQFKAPPPAIPVLSATPACGSTTAITINGTSSNNSEFFDPGADAGGPGFTRLKVDVSGPSAVTVSNVVFVKLTQQVTANFTVPANAASGTYTVIVTNPDGQTATTTFNLNCGTPTCGDPTGLTSSPIDNNNETVSWLAVANAISYDVDYKLTSSATWTNAATATASTSVNIGLLTQGTTYDWRVRANCSTVSGNYVAAQFTTTAPCTPPTGLTSSSITSNSATVSWSAVGGANNYDVDYSLAGQNAWVSAATATNSLSVNISSLSSTTNYDWRVRANCSSVPSGYSTGQFTTLAPAPCNAPTGLTSSAITSSGATVSWSTVSGANNYDVDYSLAGQNIWTNAATATTNLSANITGLSSSTNYDWRVRANCASGPSGYSIAQFTTTAVTCPDLYEPNESVGAAKSIPVNTNINASISSGNDKDYFSFSTSGNSKNIKATLTNLAANYNLTLYNNNGNVLRTSANGGTLDETIIYNTNKANTYRISVLGANITDFSLAQCYTLKVSTGSSNFTALSGDVVTNNDESNNISLVRGGLKLYPIPASTAVTISFDAYAKGNADIVIVNQLGQQVLFKKVLVSDGINFNTIDVSALKNGVYTLKVNNGKEIQTKKMIINK